MTRVLHVQTMGTPTVAVMTLVMAGSLVQASTVTAGVRQEGRSGGVRWNMRRFRLIAAALLIICRLMLVRCNARPDEVR